MVVSRGLTRSTTSYPTSRVVLAATYRDLQNLTRLFVVELRPKLLEGPPAIYRRARTKALSARLVLALAESDVK